MTDWRYVLTRPLVAHHPALAGVALNDTLDWLRDSPLLNAAAGALGLTSEQLDDLFRQAATIQL